MFTLKLDSIRYTSKQFGIWRVAFGFFLTFYYFRLFPYAEELFSNLGPFAGIPKTTTYRTTFFPAFLLAWDTPSIATGIVGACALLSILIMIGFRRKMAAFALWLLITWLYNRNPFTDSPDYSYVNWLVFILIFLPDGECFSLGPKNPDWEMPRSLYWAAWIVLSVGYLLAGSTKFSHHDISWVDGTAMYYVLTSDPGRLTWYGDLFNNIPMVFMKLLSWSVVFLQASSPFFVLFRRTRFWWWLVITGMQFGILFFLGVTEVTWGMLLFHAFLWDQGWIKDLKDTKVHLSASFKMWFKNFLLPASTEKGV